MDYRVPIFNIIAEEFDVTVGYYLEDCTIEECKFKKKKFDFFQIGPFAYIKSLRSYCRQFDVVIFANSLQIVNYCLLPFGRRSYKVLTWGIGLRASRTRLYDVNRKHTFLDRISQSICSASDASIFYVEKSKEFWKDTSLDMRKVFVATNTTKVEHMEICPQFKNSLLFVGTLYKEKGIMTLLNAYKEALPKMKEPLPLHIVGSGAEEVALRQYAEEIGISKYAIFHGAIYDEVVLASYFQRALLCVSPHQAGLSVSKSMGYGVPFVTHINAITGGEKYHITPSVNGLFYDNDTELVDIMVDASLNPNKYIEMGMKAKEFYDTKATPRHMAQGVIDAIRFVLSE